MYLGICIHAKFTLPKKLAIRSVIIVFESLEHCPFLQLFSLTFHCIRTDTMLERRESKAKQKECC